MYFALDRNKKNQSKTQIVLTLSHAAPQSLGQKLHKIIKVTIQSGFIYFFLSH